MNLPFQIDYEFALNDVIGGDNPSVSSLDNLGPQLRQSLQAVLKQVTEGQLGFWDLPIQDENIEEVSYFVKHQIKEDITDILLLGIGGSSLGTRAIYHACLNPIESLLSRKIHFVDNSDPWNLGHVLDYINPQSTFVIVVSKSGSTIETAAQFLIIREWFEKKIDQTQFHKQCVIITDPQAGPLRSYAQRHHIHSFDVPSNVGGRFSVLSAVGLVPVSSVGINIHELLSGAQKMRQLCESDHCLHNPALLLAGLFYLHMQHKKTIHVLMPYADTLRSFSSWFVQLWAESLGKRVDRNGNVIECGPTPISAIGATDQHAQLQLFMEGPRDKLIIFLKTNNHSQDLSIPFTNDIFSELGGKSLGQLLNAEHIGSASSLASNQRPSITISFTEVSPSTLGSLFFLFEAVTAIMGELLNIDAFNQPGVEQAKKLAMKQLLGTTPEHVHTHTPHSQYQQKYQLL